MARLRELLEDAIFEIQYSWEKLISPITNLPSRLKFYAQWFIFLRGDNHWDYHYVWRTQHFKLIKLYQDLKHSFVDWEEPQQAEDIAALKKAIVLTGRLKRDKYEELTLRPVDYKKALQEASDKRDLDIKELHEIIKNHSRGWWW